MKYNILLSLVCVLSGCASTQVVTESEIPQVALADNFKLEGPDHVTTETQDVDETLSTDLKTQASLLKYALRYQGYPYVYGGDSPKEGFDCSGFIQHVFHEQGISLPRTARDQWRALSAVASNDKRPGDLLFFNTGPNRRRGVGHVALYLGDNKFIHAPSKRTGHVTISNLDNRYWRRHFVGVRRARSLLKVSAN